MPFRNSILAGTTLIRQAIESENFAPGVSGWAIRRDGTAEFADLTIRSSDGSGATVVIENGRATFTSASGWKIIIDPTPPLFPVITFEDPSGTPAGTINATGVIAEPGLILSSGEFTEGAFTDWQWIMAMGDIGIEDQWTVRRVRGGDPDTFRGGYYWGGKDKAQVALADSVTPTVNTTIDITEGLFLLDRGRAWVASRASTLPALRVDTEAGHTGTIMTLRNSVGPVATVDTAGNLAVSGAITAGNSTVVTGNVVISGAGSATWTSQSYEAVQFGKLWYLSIYLDSSAAGSGTSNVIISGLPFTPRRNQRQMMPVYGSAGTTLITGSAVIMTGGAGAQIDSVRTNLGTGSVGTIRGSDITSNDFYSIQGWLLEV